MTRMEIFIKINMITDQDLLQKIIKQGESFATRLAQARLLEIQEESLELANVG